MLFLPPVRLLLRKRRLDLLLEDLDHLEFIRRQVVVQDVPVLVHIDLLHLLLLVVVPLGVVGTHII